jgi:acetate kinase
LIFTAGIGENDAALRTRVCRQAAWLGIEINQEANERRELKISVGYTTPSVWVIPTDEERMIAMHTFRVVGAGGGGD